MEGSLEMKKRMHPTIERFLKKCPEPIRHLLGIRYVGREKRIHPRRETSEQIKYRYEYVHNRNSEKEFKAHLHDISEGGVCFTSKTPVAQEMVLNIKIHIRAFGATIPILVRTIWSKPFHDGDADFYRIGAAFIDIDKPSQNMIRKYVALDPAAN